MHNCLVQPTINPLSEHLQMLHESNGEGTELPGLLHLVSGNKTS